MAEITAAAAVHAPRLLSRPKHEEVPESLPLNRLPHRLIVEEELREDYARDGEAVIAASDLAAHLQDALRQPGFDAAVEAGAHPLLALSSRQVVRLVATEAVGTGS